MACLEEAFHPRQHHALAVAAEIARAQSGREHLAIHARQLALEPRPQILRRHPRPLLLRLEQAHRHALENQVHRDQRLGLPVMIIKTWYNALPLGGVWAQAPYLHNGSVPTLYHLLVPSERPTVFMKGRLDYDKKLVGYAWD